MLVCAKLNKFVLAQQIFFKFPHTLDSSSTVIFKLTDYAVHFLNIYTHTHRCGSQECFTYSTGNQHSNELTCHNNTYIGIYADIARCIFGSVFKHRSIRLVDNILIWSLTHDHVVQNLREVNLLDSGWYNLAFALWNIGNAIQIHQAIFPHIRTYTTIGDWGDPIA